MFTLAFERGAGVLGPMGRPMSASGDAHGDSDARLSALMLVRSELKGECATTGAGAMTAEDVLAGTESRDAAFSCSALNAATASMEEPSIATKSASSFCRSMAQRGGTAKTAKVKPKSINPLAQRCPARCKPSGVLQTGYLELLNGHVQGDGASDGRGPP